MQCAQQSEVANIECGLVTLHFNETLQMGEAGIRQKEIEGKPLESVRTAEPTSQYEADPECVSTTRLRASRPASFAVSSPLAFLAVHLAAGF